MDIPRSVTIHDRMQATGNFTTGFDYLRITLALAVAVWHGMRIATGWYPDRLVLDQIIWTGPFHFLPAMIIPLFFALSGFLVAGSLLRTRLHQFVALRVLRLVPALAVEITLSALLLGAAFTVLPMQTYFTSPGFWKYFLNIVGSIHYVLPGVFQDNPAGDFVNAQLWTIPYELKCYIALAVMSIVGLVASRRSFALIVLLAIGALTLRALFLVPITARGDDHVSGHSLVLCFLAAVGLYLYRDRLPYSTIWGVVSAGLAALCLEFTALNDLAALPAAYLVVWLGLMTPPRIPFGDLSYGVYLFHFPIEQGVIHLFPLLREWWQVSLIALPPTVLCAWLSWNLVERPILSRKRQILAWIDRRAYEMTARFIQPFFGNAAVDRREK